MHEVWWGSWHRVGPLRLPSLFPEGLYLKFNEREAPERQVAHEQCPEIHQRVLKQHHLPRVLRQLFFSLTNSREVVSDLFLFLIRKI